MKTFLSRLLLFLLPFLLILGVEFYVFPIHRFTRLPEALGVYKMRRYFPGSYYPNYQLTRVDAGDLGHDSSYAEPRLKRWVTDAYGNRFDGPARPFNQYDIILVGDSNLSQGPSQEDLPYAQLNRKTGWSVYSYSVHHLRDFLEDPVLADARPKVVVWVQVERSLHDIAPAREGFRAKTLWEKSPWAVRRSMIVLDRLCKQVLLKRMRSWLRSGMRHVYARIRGQSEYNVNILAYVGTRPPMLFMKEDFFVPPQSAADIRRDAHTLREYRDRVRARGSELIFFPVPNKSTIYYRSLGLAQSPGHWDQSVEAIRQEGVRVLDILPLFSAHAERSPDLLYYADDSHWNELGISIGMDCLEKEIRQVWKDAPSLAISNR